MEFVRSAQMLAIFDESNRAATGLRLTNSQVIEYFGQQILKEIVESECSYVMLTDRPVGFVLQDIRLCKNLQLIEACCMFGMSVNELVEIEAGSVPLPVAKMQEMCIAYKVNPNKFPHTIEFK